ncbi:MULTISPECIES: FtsX-like permease family protein [Pseudomonas]|uniref:FtsX-like permease family protein n=1 Tax=Pseudomonas TaxID=286 RepID=UPI000B743010|nr:MULTISPECIES: FtsX-like permease family protein [Pseudomonas]MBH3395134.1 ABC transporter permease [Pseudomonas monteilii]SNS82455.1 putative ABC transport system permease protein [Pseudomonas sp. LAMO17WK12:I8]SNY17581.1 putative ABC transport system permease protein [Pseudomonas sp. LAMO17WK12:I11]SNY17617.1 putative ABC transport system permease protein [Pseudomonas sp. LAMO17WK12:I7]SNY20112.1 putative ABC transport system permease protein [Pseudomonas sp. LAMO17WK12:I12]
MRLLSLALLALLSHWRRHRVQFVSIFTGLWLATALWTGVQALNSQARSDYARASAVLAGPMQAQFVPRKGEHFDQKLYVQLRKQGWQVTPMLEGRLRLSGEPVRSVRLIGIDPLSLPPTSSIAGVQPQAFDLQAFIGTPGQAWVGPDTLRQWGEGSMRDSEGQPLPPVVLQPALAPGIMVVDIGHAQRLLHAPGQLSRLLVAGKPGPLPADIAALLELQPQQDDDGLQRLTDSFHLNLTALGLLAFVVGLFIAHAAIGLALEQRRGLIRNLRACGVSLNTLLGALVLELGLFALLGGLAGVASGYVLAAWLLPDVAVSLRGLYGAQVAGTLSLPAGWWLAGVLVSVLGALLAGLGSVLRAARLPLLALAQPQAWRLAQGLWSRRQACAAGLLLLLALGFGVLGNSLACAFAMLAGLLLASALLLPALLDHGLGGLTRFCRRPLVQWFVADSRQQLPALSLALMALLLALAASVGVGSMTEGFRKTFVGWLDMRLSADLYVTPKDTEQGLQIAEWLGQQSAVIAVLPGWRVETRLQGWPVQVQGIVDHPLYLKRWPLLEQQPRAWEQLSSGQAVMLSEQLARRLKLHLGDRLALSSQAMTVVGVYADYGNPKGHVLVNAGWLRSHWPQATLTGLSVDLHTDQVPVTKAALQQHFALDDSRVVEQVRLKSWSTEVFNRTFAATAALNSLTLGVAGVALFINLLTLGQTRLGQLAPLWALGVQRRQLVWLSLGQTLMLSSFTVLLAIPLGVLLAWCLVAVVNVQAFGWRLPLYVFPAQLLQLAVLGLLTSLLASAWPLWQLARRQPRELLRPFADEA